MEPKGHRSVREVFDRVVDLPAEERRAKLAELCRDDLDLVRDVELLLDAHEHLEGPGKTTWPQRLHADFGPAAVRSGSLLDRYELAEVIGEGGFGVVYRARQRDPVERDVAVKVIKLGMDTREVLARFDAERQALALMDHPGIARVLDAGATETGCPYFVMELVHGLPITTFCDEHRLRLDGRLRLFIDVCHAVQHAHQKGIIHRDIKPSNVLVTRVDDRPVPKIIDFGVAKATGGHLTDLTLQTSATHVIGTPAYMSPEQTGLPGVDIDTRSDVYSLGVLLYELLAGVLPLDVRSNHGVLDIQRVVREVEPRVPSSRLSATGAPPASGATLASEPDVAAIAMRRSADPRTLARAMRGDLDWIVMKCLEKDRARRYATSNELASDVKRHLDGLPVVAGPPSRVYRARKFLRRHRAGVLTAALLAMTLAGATAVSARSAVREARQRRRAEESGQIAERELDRAREIKQLVTSMIGSVDPAIAQGLDTSIIRLWLVKTTQGLERGEIEDPLVEAELRDILGMTLITIGDDDEAEPMLTEALALRREHLGDAAPETLDAIHHMGRLREAQGDRAEAEALYRQAFEARERVLGTDDPGTLESLTSLAFMLKHRGEFDEARRMYLRALQGFELALGDDSEPALSVRNNLGDLAAATGDYPAARAWHEASLSGRRRVLGSDHPHTLQSMANLSTVHFFEARYDDAIRLCRDALDARKRVLGPAHPETLVSRGNLAVMLVRTGRAAEAEPLYQAVLEERRRGMGDEHPDTLMSMHNLGSLYFRLGRFDEAEETLLDVLERRRRILGDGDAETLKTINALGAVAMGRGRLADAEPWFQESLAGRRTLLGDDHPSSLIAINNLATLLKDLDRLDEAEPLFLEGLERRRRVLGPDHPDTLDSAHGVGMLRAEQGRLDEAIEQCEAALDARRRVHGDAHPDTIESMQAVAGLLERVDRPNDAIGLARAAHEGRLATVGESHPETFKAAATLGVILARSGDPAAGTALAAEAANRALATLGAGHPAAHHAFVCVADAFQAWDAADPGAGHDAQARMWRERGRFATTHGEDSSP